MNSLVKNILQRQFTKVWNKNKKEHPIHWVELEITRRCPLNCRHCGSSCSIDNPYAIELDKDQILKQFARIAEEHDPTKINAVMTGGEPLIRKDIYEIMAKISEMGFSVGMVTSGYPFKPDTHLYLAAAGVKSISVSIDGLEATHNNIRRRPDAFKRAVNAIKQLVKSGHFYVEPISTINKLNISELEAIESLMKDLGVNSWRLGRTFPRGRAKDDAELLLDPMEYKRMLDFVKKRFYPGSSEKVLKRKELKVHFCEEGYLGEYELEVRDQFHQCGAGINILTILANGDVTGCAALSERFIQGNVLEDDILDMWENRYQIFRDRSWTRTGPCRYCKNYDFCEGDGLHLWDDPSGPAICNYAVLQQAKKLKS